jgi:hypothetical protein
VLGNADCEVHVVFFSYGPSLTFCKGHACKGQG